MIWIEVRNFRLSTYNLISVWIVCRRSLWAHSWYDSCAILEIYISETFQVLSEVRHVWFIEYLLENKRWKREKKSISYDASIFFILCLDSSRMFCQYKIMNLFTVGNYKQIKETTKLKYSIHSMISNTVLKFIDFDQRHEATWKS